MFPGCCTEVEPVPPFSQSGICTSVHQQHPKERTLSYSLVVNPFIALSSLKSTRLFLSGPALFLSRESSRGLIFKPNKKGQKIFSFWPFVLGLTCLSYDTTSPQRASLGCLLPNRCLDPE